MILSDDSTYLKQLVEATSLFFNIRQSLVQKDYFICQLLKNCTREINGLVFKGGTSLSKCHKVINRFSEDIDLTLDLEHSSQTFKRNSIRKLAELCDKHPLKLINKEQRLLHTHSNYNCFRILYPLYQGDDLKEDQIKLEMVYLSKCYPSEKSMIRSYIGEYLSAINRVDLIKEFELEPFQIQVQSLSRTLVDKVFAICDYYLRNEVQRNSRHIYDICQILTEVELNDDLKELIHEVRVERQKSDRCPSSLEGVSINKILNEIISSNFYKRDYENVTRLLLFKDFQYEDAIKSLDTIIKSNIF